MPKFFLRAGQSNEMCYPNRVQLTPVLSWAQTVPNGWEGHPTRSADTGIEYAHPTLANFPCLYAEYYGQPLSNSWGQYLGQTPLATGTQERGAYGPELSFMWKWREANPGEPPPVVLKVALGGTSIDQWLPPSGSMWQIFLSELNKAKARLAAQGIEAEFAAFTFGQGESGAASVYPYLHPTTGSEYKDKLRTLLATVRSLTRPDLPCIIARVGSQQLTPAVIGSYSSGEDTPENRLAAVYNRRAQQVEVGSDPGNVWSDRDFLPTYQQGPDQSQWLHLTGSGVLADGERQWAAFAGPTQPPPPPPPLVVKFNGVVKPWAVALNGEPVGKDGDVIDITGGS